LQNQTPTCLILHRASVLPGRNARLSLDTKQKERDNSTENAMNLGLATLPARRSTVGLLFAFILVLSATPVHAIQMVRIAQFNEYLGGDYPCGSARHDGRFGVYGTISDSIVAYEYEGNNFFQRIVTGGLSPEGIWAFGDGNGDSLDEVVGLGQVGASVVILKSRTDTSYPSDSVWGADPDPSAANYPYPKYMDFFRDGHRDLAMLAQGSEGLGVCLFENTGNNQYSLAAEFRDTVPDVGPDGDFDVGDLDQDSLMELVAGSTNYWFYVFKATGRNHQYVMTRCSTETFLNYNVAVAHDMDHDGLPEVIVFGHSPEGGPEYEEVMIYEATAVGGYHEVWEQSDTDWYQGFCGNQISVGDVDGDGVEEFAVNTGGTVALFKCTGPHSYSQVWTFNATGNYVRLFDIKGDGRAQVIFDGPNRTEIWEDTEGLGVAEFSKFSLQSPVKVSPSVVRLGASLLLSGLPPGADIEFLSLDGRLVMRTQAVRQSTWTWNLRDQSGNLVPAGTYFALIRSKEKSTSLKLCVVK
jgi:hypothetical protein